MQALKLPIRISQKLLQLMQGEYLPGSALKHPAVEKMIEDGVIEKKQVSKSKVLLFVLNRNSLVSYINNHFGIKDLAEYVSAIGGAEITRATAVAISSDSKIKSIRTFKGFLVNSFENIEATLLENKFIISPIDGSFVFIHDFEAFKIPPTATVVGVENFENFSYIRQQQYLFKNIGPILFVSRYPQSNDLIKWLQTISNPYIHFGDFDLAGIQIYLNEYKRHLKGNCSFFIPDNVEYLLAKYGNRSLYNNQLTQINFAIEEPQVAPLIKLIYQYKKGLEQEILIDNKNL